MILECDGSDGSPHQVDEPTSPIVHSELALDFGFATGLAWDTVGKRVVLAVRSLEPTQADRLCLCETLGPWGVGREQHEANAHDSEVA